MDGSLMRAALKNRLFAYRYVWRFFADYADTAFLGVVCDEGSQEHFDLLFGKESDGAAIQRALADEARALLAEPDCLERLKTEYTKLFLGPKRLPSLPWESPYIDTPGVILQQSTLEVRRAYHAAGYEASGYPHEADDHIAIELNFMASLCADCLSELDSGSSDGVNRLLGMQRDFLHDHLNRWVASFAEGLCSVDDGAAGNIYMLAAQLSAALCLQDEEIIGDFLDM